MQKKNLSVPVHHNVSAMVLPADDLADYNPHYIDLILNITSRHTETNIYLTHLYSRYNLLTITTIPISHWTIIVLPLLQYLSISHLSTLHFLLTRKCFIASFFLLLVQIYDRQDYVFIVQHSVESTTTSSMYKNLFKYNLKMQATHTYMWKGH